MCSLARVSDALGVKLLVAQFGLILTSTCLGQDLFHLDRRNNKRIGRASTPSNQPRWLERCKIYLTFEINVQPVPRYEWASPFPDVSLMRYSPSKRSSKFEFRC
jgi:hypothetical protein